MPSTINEFKDDTGFERLLLDRATPLLPRSESRAVIDLRSVGSTSVARKPVAARVDISLTDSLGSSDRGVSADDLRPLIFGAAWKVLDLLVELSYEMNGVPPGNGRQYLIKEKVGGVATSRVGSVPPFDSHATLWSRLLQAYSSTTTLRNSLVHRKLIIDPSTGEMMGVPKLGDLAPIPLTTAEHTAFCQAVQGAAQAVIDSKLSTRRINQLSWTLDQLTAHHGQPSLGATAVRGIVPTVLATAEVSQDMVTLDAGFILARARLAVDGVSYFDLKLYIPDGRILTGALEDAPTGMVTFPLDEPPSWLQWT
ncbi:hypothetical protein FDG2_0607 [Candidatus Protofrankia californiensis]|uniref:Uncharacterized protein n=1 Tax=Candidatus Protofrankia californiensis TaxID=1839754 RepID=A0A1C3NTX1_9ACTN|nr:hypothetical protein FDG2_0607 [Candidatus Protofrankia californiensis]